MIPYGRQAIQDSDIEAVTEVLRSDFLTQGPAVPMFERAVAHRVSAKFGVACNSATSALHIACLALKLTPGQRLWTVPNTFVASANCARYCGADVDFVDIDPLTWNLSVAALRERLARAKSDDTLPQIVVPVHFAGQPTDQQAIWELAQEYGFRVIEDASHSIGALRDGERVGSCRWSDITVFSFHPVKIITSGEGGMALTNDPAIAEYMAMFRSHGVTRDPAKFHDEGADTGAWYYDGYPRGAGREPVETLGGQRRAAQSLGATLHIAAGRPAAQAACRRSWEPLGISSLCDSFAAGNGAPRASPNF
jgi:dTDP-4-amino-4,6-dideoxygalactose transaminase